MNSNGMEIKRIKRWIKETEEYIEEYKDRIEGLRAVIVSYKKDVVHLEAEEVEA